MFCKNRLEKKESYGSFDESFNIGSKSQNLTSIELSPNETKVDLSVLKDVGVNFHVTNSCLPYCVFCVSHQIPLDLENIPIPVDTDTLVVIIEQFLMLILIIGRWMLPKGDLTR